MFTARKCKCKCQCKCGNIFAEWKGFERRPKKKGKQEYRVSGSWNRQPGSTWSKLRHSLKSGEWDEHKNTFRNEGKVSEWAFDRIKEAFENVAKDEARKLSTVQSIIAPAGRQRCVTMSFLCPHCNSFPMEDYVWWVSGEENITTGGARSVDKNRTGSNQTGFWCKQVKVETRPKSSERMQYLRALAEIWSMR